MLAVWADGAPRAALADHRATRQPVSATAFSAPSNYIVHGAHISPVAPASSTAGRHYYQEIDAFASTVGKAPAIAMYFISFTYVCDDGYLPQNANNPPGNSTTRAIMITWSPFDDGTSSRPSDYDNILNGSYDGVIDDCADKLKPRAPQVFLIRFMHEMNLAEWPWYAGQPWNQKPDGTGDTAKFIQAWRYVVDRFRAKSVANVQWVWAPNYASNPNLAWNHYSNYYPGDNYVDWVGLSGYNWSTFRSQPILSYASLYDAALIDLQCRYPKPIVHAEIGSVEFSQGTTPMNKAGWITDAFSRMQAYPLLRAVVWFNDFAFHNTSDADFRVTNVTGNNYGPPPLHDTSGFPVDGSWTSAYSTAVSDSSFTSTFTSNQLLNPPMTRCASDSISSNGVLAARPSSDLVARSGLTTTQYLVGALGLPTDTAFTVSGCPSNVTCTFASTGTTTSSTFTTPWDAETLNIAASGSAQLGTFTLTISGGSMSTTVLLQVVSNIYQVFLPSIQK